MRIILSFWNSELSRGFQSRCHSREWKQKRQRCVEHRDGAIAGIPARYPFILGVDQQWHARLRAKFTPA